jgi:HPt (histidine-containing phosphotransfer) domain-containing protein
VADRLHPEFADLWPGSLPRIEAALAGLTSAVGNLAAGPIDAPARAEAQRHAHKLVGTLGTYGLVGAAATARELELAFADGAGPEAAPDLGERVESLAAAVRAAGA